MQKKLPMVESILTHSLINLNGLSDFLYLENCFLDGRTGLVLDSDLNLIPESAMEYIWWNPQWIEREPGWPDNHLKIIESRLSNAYDIVKDKLSNRELQVLDENTVHISLLHPHARYAFGHLFDSLHKLAFFDSKVVDLKSTCLLVSDYSDIKDFDYYINSLASGAKYINNRFAGADGFSFWRCPKLALIKPRLYPARLNQFTHSFILKSMVKHSFDLKDGRVKLFLTRRKGEVLRCIKNAEDLESKLLSNGILVLDGSEPIEDVIDLFSRASHISGYHGSLFANTIYSPSDCKVYEFCSNKRVDYSFMIKFKFINDYIVDLIDADEQHDVALNIDELMSFYSQV